MARAKFVENKTYRIKIFLVEQRYDDDSYSNQVIREGVSDWQEVTAEELDYLQRHLHRIVQHREFRPTIIIADETPVKLYVEDIKALIRADAEAEEKRKAELERIKQEKLLKKKAKTEEQERQLLAALAQKYGAANTQR